MFVGAGTTIAAIDNGNDIGGTSAATGNTITGWGGGAPLSSYISVTGSNYCVYMNQQINDNFSFNNITSAALAQSVTTGGFLKAYTIASPTTGTITTTINNNTVTITNNTTGTTTGAIIGLNNQGLTPLLSTATMSMNNNTVQNSVLGGTTSTTNGLTAITNFSLPGTMNMTGNNVINNAITATTATSGALVGISNSGAAGTVNLNSNIVRGFSSTATTGQVQGISNSGLVTTAININNNQLGNGAGGFYSSAAANTGALFGMVNAAGNAAALLTMTGNDIRGIVYTGAASAAQNYYNNQVFTGSVNISNNTITNITVNTTGGVTMIGNSVTRVAGTTANVNNNSIVTQFTKTAAGGTVAFYNSFGSSPATVTEINTGNNFSNVTFSGATSFIGWRSADGTSPGPRKTITNNTFSNITGGTSALSSILYVGFSDSTFALNNVSGNVISNVSAAASISAIFSDGQNQNFFDNRVNTLNSTGVAANVRAFELTGATTQNIFRNKIYDLQATDAAGTVNGILISLGGTTFNVYNNLIGDLRTPNANAANPLIGINITAGTTVNVYYNTVYLNASSTGGTFGSSAIFASTTPTVTLRNNIFVNNSTTAGTGLAVAHRRSAAGLGTYGAASNNNDFFASTIFSDGATNITTIAAYKTFVTPRDAASFSELPPFLSTVGSSPNFLHIDPTVATQTESGGAPIAGFTTDYDLDTRNASTPDVGADEFNGIGIDLAAPIITYTTLPNTGVTTNRVLSVTITDATGVASGANLPRIYFKRSTDAGYVSTQCVMTGGTPQNGTYNCTIDYSILVPPGVVTGNVVQYFVVAQDTLGNLGSNPAGATGASVNSVTFAGTPNSYTIVAGFSGSYNVGPAETVTSLTNTGGIFDLINQGALNGNVTINITGDMTGELGTVALNQSAEDGIGGYTVLIKPSGGPRTITGSNAGALIKLNGADRVRIDGSTAASFVDDLAGGNPALRELTIQNTNVGTSAVVISIQTGTNGAQNDTIQNVNVLGQDPTTTLIGISMGGNTPGTAGLDNDGNRLINNTVKRAVTGIYSSGISAANPNLGTIIQQNDLSATTIDRIRQVGMVVFNEDGIQIVDNSVGGIDNTGVSADAVGIGVGTNSVDNSSITSGGVINAVVNRNKVNGVSNDTTFSAIGIAVAGGTTGPNTISNNMITGVISDATSPDLPAGIWVAGVVGSTTRLYYNSVSMTGDRSALLTPGTGQTPSFGIAITGSNPTVELKNNIFYTTQTADVVANPAAKSYAIGTTSTTFTALDSNYNLFWSTGVQDGGFRSGSLAAASGTDYAALPAWRTATGGSATDDFNSLEGDPVFVNPLSNLHLNSIFSPAYDKATPVSVLDDFDAQIRATIGLAGGVPDIGADEILAPLAASISLGGRVTTFDGVNGIPRATVTLSGGNLTRPITVKTNPLGYYDFDDVEVGTYILTVEARMFTFSIPTRVVTAEDNIKGLDFTANP